MKKSNQIPIFLYALVDVFMAAAAWALFFFVRKWLLKQYDASAFDLQANKKFWLSLIFIPLGWLILYTLAGTYRSLYKKSRLFELTTTFVCTFFGCMILLFLFILEDVKNNYSYYYSAHPQGHWSLLAG